MPKQEIEDFFKKLVEKFANDNDLPPQYKDDYASTFTLFDIMITCSDDNIQPKISIETILKRLYRMIILSKLDEPYFAYRAGFDYANMYTKLEIGYKIFNEKAIKKMRSLISNEEVEPMEYSKIIKIFRKDTFGSSQNDTEIYIDNLYNDVISPIYNEPK